MSGILFVVATPLGNPEDLSPRAIATLGEVDTIFAEDTRSGAGLLKRCGLHKPMRSCFDANERARAAELTGLLAEGKRVALISEAGTPAISDPGYQLVRAALAAGARVVPVPGPSAVLAALVASGLPTDRFFFAGFPPRKPGARRRLFESLRALPATLVLYESPHRVATTLTELVATLGGGRQACVARELTKRHEELLRGTLSELAVRYAEARPLGEVTLVVGGAATADEADGLSPGTDGDADTLAARAAALRAEGRSHRDTVRLLAEETGRPRREIYELVLALPEASKDPEGAPVEPPPARPRSSR
jgi:16S rRNA (cytidine1402-2'-O)-methyltransferase